MKTTVLILCMSMLLAGSLASSSAWATELSELAKPKIAEAKEHLSKGNRLYRVREFERAIEEYKAGAIIEDVPVFGYNLAQCYRQIGRYEEAIWHYERFMFRVKPTGEMKEAIEGFLVQMKAELEKQAMSKPPIEPAPEASPAPPPPASVEVPKIEAAIEPAEAWYRDKVGWAVSGAGVVGASVALGFFVSASGLDSDSNGATNDSGRDEIRARAHDRRVIGTVVGVAGGAALAVGIVKLAIYPKGRDDKATTALDLGVTSTGLLLTGRF